MFILASGGMFDGCSEEMLWSGTLNSPRELGRAAPKAVEETVSTKVEVEKGVMLS